MYSVHMYPCTPKLLLLEPGYEATAIHACLPSVRTHDNHVCSMLVALVFGFPVHTAPDIDSAADFKVSAKVSGYKRTWIQYLFSLDTCERGD